MSPSVKLNVLSDLNLYLFADCFAILNQLIILFLVVKVFLVFKIADYLQKGSHPQSFLIDLHFAAHQGHLPVVNSVLCN